MAIMSLRLRNFKRVYRLSRWVQQKFTPSGQFVLLAILASGVLGIDTTSSLSYQIFSLLLAMIWLAMLYARFNYLQFRCVRHLPSIATVGQPFTYSMRVNNEAPTAQSEVLLVEKLGESFPTETELQHYRDETGADENWFDRTMGFLRWARLVRIKTGAEAPNQMLPQIPAGHSVDLQLTMTPLRRGYLSIVGTRVTSPDPTGLVRSHHDSENIDSLLVLPKRYAIPDLQLSGHRNHHQGGIALSSSVGESNEFFGIREYQPGDPIRRIHWRSWARQNKPMVKTYEDEYFVRHALILDTYAQGIGTQIFEEAVSVAASVALDVSDQESLLDLMFVEGKAYQFTSGRGLSDIQSLLEILACVQPDYNTPIESLQAMVMQHVSQLSSAIFILLDWDEPRQALVTAVKESGITPIVFLIVEQNDDRWNSDFKAEHPEVIALIVGDIENSLAHIA